MTPELTEHICRLADDRGLKAILDELKQESTRNMLNAKTPEDREEYWRDYHALKRLGDRLQRLAAEAKT